MKRSARLRRCILLCCHFARNLAYHRARPKGRGLPAQTEFWNTVDGNFLDIAVLEWWKLFDQGAQQGWQKVVSDKQAFEQGMLLDLGVTNTEFAALLRQIRHYRDKFVAHLDSENDIAIPQLEMAKSAVHYYHQHIYANELEHLARGDLPADLEAYYQERLMEGKSIYAKVNGIGK